MFILPKETPEEKRRRFLETARAAVTGAYATDEHAIMQAINSYNAIEKIRNMMHERLEEWYSIYFPELKLANQATYAKFVVKFGSDKKAASKEELSNLIGEKGDDLYNSIQRSIGREPSKDEFNSIKKMAENEIELNNLSDDIDAYLKESTKKIMPNIIYLIDYKIAAELLAKAGSLEKFALMPASTVQLLGAEKSFFKHIKYGSKPPKYGILFKLPEVTAAPKMDKGRIARLYATKICIAAKADAFSHNFIAEQLKESIDEQAKNIKENPRPNVPSSENRRGMRGGRDEGKGFKHGRKPWQDKPRGMQRYKYKKQE